MRQGLVRKAHGKCGSVTCGRIGQCGRKLLEQWCKVSFRFSWFLGRDDPAKRKTTESLGADDSLCLPVWAEPSARHQNPGNKCPCAEEASLGHLVWAEANREELIPLLGGLRRPLSPGSVMGSVMRVQYVSSTLGGMEVGPASKALLGLCARSAVHCGG